MAPERFSSRRRFVAALAACGLLASASARAQPERPKRVIHLMPSGPVPTEQMADLRRFRRAAWARHGMREGRDYFETLVEGPPRDLVEFERLARDAVQRRPDLIIVNTAGYASLLQRLTRDIPIVFYDVSDPVRWKLVKSMQRPGGNLTGVASGMFEAMVKRLELLKEIRPTARRVAWLALSGIRSRPVDDFVAEMSVEASRLGLALVEIGVAPGARSDEVIDRLRAARADGYIPYSLPAIEPPVELLDLQKRAGTPAFVGSPVAVKRGALACFGSAEDMFDQMLSIASKIVRGEHPSRIPVLQPARWHLAVNLATARELGIEVPASVLVRATETFPA